MTSPERRLPVVLVAIGALTLAGQIILLREASVAFFGVELAYLLGLGVWLVCGALGAAIAPSRAGRRSLALLLMGLPTSVAAAGVLLRASRMVTGGTPGAYLPLHVGIAMLLLSLGPPALLAGISFPVAARLYRRELGAGFGRAYALECAGGGLGGLGVTAGLALGASAALMVLLGSVAALGLAALLSRQGVARWGLLTLSCLVCLLLVPRSAGLDVALTRIDHPDLVSTVDSPYARLVVDERNGQTSLFANGAMVAESESILPEVFVHPVLLQHPAPQRVAVIEGTAQGLTAEVLRHDPREIVTVDLDPWSVAIARDHLPQRDSSPAETRMRALVMDPRRYLSEAPAISSPLFDVILIGGPDPESGQTNRYYTKEFFALCARHLTPQGILGLQLRAAENLWSPLLTVRLASVDRALRAELEDVMFLPGVATVVVASRSRLVTDPVILSERLRARGIQGRLVSPPYLDYLLSNERREEARQRLASTSASPNTDSRPVCYTTAAMLWLSRFIPSYGFQEPRHLETLGRQLPWWLGGALLLIGLGVGSVAPAGVRAATLAGVAGGAGMAAECVLLLHYQTQFGALFQDIGTLLVSYMVGSAIGAWLMDAHQRQRTLSPLQRIAACGAVIVLGFVIWEAVRHGQVASSRQALLGMTVLAGGIIGVLLAVAGRLGARREGTESASLYAADLLGGGIAAAVVSMLLIPLSGLDRTAIVLAVSGVAAAMMVKR